jgi:replicative DNA helicase
MTTTQPTDRLFDKTARRAAGNSDLGKLFDRLPPHDNAAEMSLLGSMIRDHTVIGDVIEIVKTGDDFYKPVHRIIFNELVTLYDRNDAGDIVQLHSRLSDAGVLEDVGGDDYLVKLAESTPSPANAVHFAEIVREKARIRSLIEAAGKILYEGYYAGELKEIDGSAQALLDRAEGAIFAIAEAAEATQAESLRDLLHATMDELDQRAEAGGALASGVPSGFYDLDNMTLGLQKGEMIIIAARPSMGKTAFCLNIAQRMATSGHPVGIFSLEMTREQVAQRMLSAEAGVDAQRMRRNQLSPEEFQRLMEACGRLGDAEIYIDDTPGLSILQLRTKARRMHARHNVQAIIIDYLQLMTGSTRESRQQEVSEISRGVKALARELRVPVICLSQLNRAAENRESHRPRMSDLRESGSIEQDADVVMLLHREDYYHQGDREYEQNDMAEIIIAKQRNGPTGVVNLKWHGATTSFRDYTPVDHGYDDAYTGTAPAAPPPVSTGPSPFDDAPKGRPTPPPEMDEDDDSYGGIPI